mmetsp:Transcript_15910/g.53237  ORF Transcript_15910/g.53237 Transcript_15910/m.53237 type:complete len:231 (+) Transcript_15910:340-1032(+)
MWILTELVEEAGRRATSEKGSSSIPASSLLSPILTFCISTLVVLCRESLTVFIPTPYMLSSRVKQYSTFSPPPLAKCSRLCTSNLSLSSIDAAALPVGVAAACLEPCGEIPPDVSTCRVRGLAEEGVEVSSSDETPCWSPRSMSEATGSCAFALGFSSLDLFLEGGGASFLAAAAFCSAALAFFFASSCFFFLLSVLLSESESESESSESESVSEDDSSCFAFLAEAFFF